MDIKFVNPGFQYMLDSIMEFQKDDASEFWNASLFYFLKELDKEYAYSLPVEESTLRRNYLRYIRRMKCCWKRKCKHIASIGNYIKQI